MDSILFETHQCSGNLHKMYVYVTVIFVIEPGSVFKTMHLIHLDNDINQSV